MIRLEACLPSVVCEYGMCSCAEVTLSAKVELLTCTNVQPLHIDATPKVRSIQLRGAILSPMKEFVCVF